ncbi:hypothetical protein [Xenorhabdus bovienii]|uniref:hypothetical protein n=1 Tax=Xenorhabdus bovienii TaxID=40576 RepID=UPI0012D35679|nr:hypothetical protein [Xenorhabdus bovienii]
MLRSYGVRITQYRLSPLRDTGRALFARPRRAIMGQLLNGRRAHEPHRYSDQQ